MRPVVLLTALTLGPWTMAHELDTDSTISPQQIEKAKDLPQTTVIRVLKSDPTKIEVVHLKDRLPAGQKVTGLKFEQMAMNAEVTGLAFTSGNELDTTSSTSSWGFGYGGGGYRGGGFIAGGYRGGGGGFIAGGYRGGGYYGGGYRGGYYGGGYGGYPNGYYGGGYGGGYYANTTGCGGGYYAGGCGGYGGWAYPNYNYAGYVYNYQPYWGYSDDNYYYAYCGWPYATLY